MSEPAALRSGVLASRSTGSASHDQPSVRGTRWRPVAGRWSPAGWRELVLAAAVLAAVAAAVYGTHVRDGGFIMDDWSNRAKTRFLASCCGVGATGHGSGYLAQVHNLLSDGPAGYHIGLPVLIPLSYRAFRPAIAPHLALAVALAVSVSVCMYAVLRRFRLAPVHAGMMAALVLVFPWSDANRLWAMAGYNQVGVVLWLVGLLVALRGVRASGGRAVLLHAAALACYAAGIAVYELLAADRSY